MASVAHIILIINFFLRQMSKHLFYNTNYSKQKMQVKLTVSSKSKEWFLDRCFLLHLLIKCHWGHTCMIFSKSFWIKMSAKCINVNGNPLLCSSSLVLLNVLLQCVYIWCSKVTVEGCIWRESIIDWLLTCACVDDLTSWDRVILNSEK